MSEKTNAPGLSAILCADWGKERGKRAAYVAEVASRTIRRVDAGEWSVATVLGFADTFASSGPVLVTFDAPLGVPENYLAAAERVQSWKKLNLRDLARSGPSSSTVYAVCEAATLSSGAVSLTRVTVPVSSKSVRVLCARS